VAAWRRESRWTVFKKLREGTYRSYLDGRVRKIILASVQEDRERQMNAPPTKKRSPGRPRKQPSSVNPELRRLAASPPKAGAAPPTPLPIPTHPKTGFDPAAARSAELDDCDPSNSRTWRRR
jgi:hypothetical protein